MYVDSMFFKQEAGLDGDLDGIPAELDGDLDEMAAELDGDLDEMAAEPGVYKVPYHPYLT